MEITVYDSEPLQESDIVVSTPIPWWGALGFELAKSPLVILLIAIALFGGIGYYFGSRKK